MYTTVPLAPRQRDMSIGPSRILFFSDRNQVDVDSSIWRRLDGPTTERQAVRHRETVVVVVTRSSTRQVSTQPTENQ